MHCRLASETCCLTPLLVQHNNGFNANVLRLKDFRNKMTTSTQHAKEEEKKPKSNMLVYVKKKKVQIKKILIKSITTTNHLHVMNKYACLYMCS